ncbi:hypothetical protein NUACC26_068340 [Scytonema sp. NUACC26]
MGMVILVGCCFLWLIGLSLLAEIWFFEEEQNL